MKEETLQLLRYRNWANQTLLNRMKEIPSEAYTKELDETFSSMAATFQHIFTLISNGLIE